MSVYMSQVQPFSIMVYKQVGENDILPHKPSSIRYNLDTYKLEELSDGWSEVIPMPRNGYKLFYSKTISQPDGTLSKFTQPKITKSMRIF